MMYIITYIVCTLQYMNDGFYYMYVMYITYRYTRSSGHSAPLLLAPAEGLGALLGAFSPLLSSSIQKYTLRQLFGHLEHQNLSIIKKSKMATMAPK